MNGQELRILDALQDLFLLQFHLKWLQKFYNLDFKLFDFEDAHNEFISRQDKVLDTTKYISDDSWEF